LIDAILCNLTLILRSSRAGLLALAHKRNYFVQQELPAARTSTSLARVLGHSAPKMPDSHKRDACFVLLGQALRAHFCLRLRSHKQKRQGNSDVRCHCEKMQNSSLLIIDPQFDFINSQGWYAHRHSSITQILKARQNIIELLRNISPEKVIILYSNYSAGQFAPNSAFCIPGTRGHKIDIPVSNDFTLIAKTAQSAFSSAQFTAFVERNRISSFFLTGFLAEYCVRTTGEDALRNGKSLQLVTDAIATGDDVQYRLKETVEYLSAQGARILSSQETLTLIRNGT
jgi:nicotinamidase-related amidase